VGEEAAGESNRTNDGQLGFRAHVLAVDSMYLIPQYREESRMTPDKSPHPFPTGGGRVPRLSVHTEYYYSSGLRKEKVGEQAESGRGGGQRER
jgi:hypothetical protein